MNKCVLLILITLLIHFDLLAQGEEKIELIEEASFELNSSIIGALLQPRKVIKVDLPPNTKSWFYQFNTTLNESNTNSFKLLSSFVSKAATAASAYYTAGASYAIKPLLESGINSIPTGESEVSIYCLDMFNQSAFSNNKKFVPLEYGTTEKQKSGRVFIPYSADKQVYIGIKNTSSMQRRAFVNIQVYAIIEKPTPVNYSNETNGWSIENKRKMFNRWLNESRKLGYIEYNCLEIARCTQTKILSAYSFSDFKNLGIDKWNEKVTSIFNQCLSQFKK